MDHKKALEDKMQRYANFHMSQIRKEESEYHDSDDDLDPKAESGLKEESPVIERTLSNSSRFSKEQLIIDANKILKTESFDRSTGTSTPTSSKKKSVVIIAPRTSSFSVSSRTSSQHQMSSTSASPTTMPDVKGVALLPPADSPISFKTEGYADVAWQNLNEKLDMLLRTDSYRTLSSSNLHQHSTSEIPRSPKRPDDNSHSNHHHSNGTSLSNGSDNGKPEGSISSRSPVPVASNTTATTTSTASRNGNSHSGSNGAHNSSNDLTRVLEQEPFNNGSTGSPSSSQNKSSMLKKKSSRSLVKRLSSHNVMVDNTLYIDDDSADEEEEVYGVAMNSNKQQQELELDRMLQVHEKQTQIKTRSMSACSSDDEDAKPVKVRDLRRAASYVYDQREAGNNNAASPATATAGSSSSNSGQRNGQASGAGSSSSLSVIVELSPPPSNSTQGTVEASPREESLSDKQRREREVQELLYQQQLQIQQLQAQQQRLIEEHLLSQQSPGGESKSLAKTQSIEQMALAYIREAQSLANQHVMSPAVSAVVNVTESWRAGGPQPPLPQQQQLLPVPQYPSAFPTTYPPQHPHSGASPQTLSRDSQHLQMQQQSKSLASASLDELLAMGLSPAEAHAIYAEHCQVRSTHQSQGNSQSNSRNNSRSNSPATMNRNSNVEGFTENPLMMTSSHSSLSSLARADFIERTISAEVDLTNVYDDSHPRQPPPVVPHLKYVPSRQHLTGGSSAPQPMLDSPQLSTRSASFNMRNSEDYPPTGKLKRSNSSNRHVSMSNNSINLNDDLASVSSMMSSRSNNSQPERVVLVPGSGRDRSPAQSHLSPLQQQVALQQQQTAMLMMPPLHVGSPSNPQYRHQPHKLDQPSLSMDHMSATSDQRVYSRSHSEPNANAGRPALSRNNVEQQQQQQQAVRLRPARMEQMDRYSGTSVSTLSDSDRHDSFNGNHYGTPPAPPMTSPNAGLFQHQHQQLQHRQGLSRQNSNVSIGSGSGGAGGALNHFSHNAPLSFPYPRDIVSHPYHQLHMQKQARSPILFGNYITIMEDTRHPDDVALDLGLTLSKQESLYGCNMFDWFDPAMDEEEVQYLMELGFARNTAIEMIFDRSRRRS